MDNENVNKEQANDQQSEKTKNNQEHSKLDHIFNKENMEATEDDAAAEQQRKEAMTERD
jgi:hypothetical protein